MGYSKSAGQPENHYVPDTHYIPACYLNPQHKIPVPLDEMEYEPVDSVGEICDIKSIWATSKSLCDCCVTWGDAMPFGKDPEHLQVAKDERNTHAIVCGHHPTGDTWVVQYIWVNNPDVKAALSSVFEGYPSVDCTSTELRFAKPFIPFAHRWKQFIELVENEFDPLLHDNLRLLHQILERELKETFKELRAFEDTGCVSFDILPLAFKPGEIILNKEDGVTVAALLRDVDRISSIDQKDVCYRFRGSQLDWDGMKCGVRKGSFQLEHFTGTRHLADMDILPLRCHPESEIITERLIARGRKFESLRGKHFLYYDGKARDLLRAISGHDWGQGTMTRVTERVMVDAKYFYDNERNSPAPLECLSGLDPRYVLKKPPPKPNAFRRMISEDDDSFHHIQGEIYEPEENEEPDYSPLTDEQCLLAVSGVFGFALESKLWCRFSVDNLKKISWNSDAIDNLVINDAEKKLILSFVSANQAADFDDFVPGKGKGLVMLLAGPPGTGKTLTAETVSEHLKRPLYRLGVSDLGTKVHDVEANLKCALRRCALWNAILLVDESDVFLETRSTDSLERNQMVSVFLRLLEYYDGVMILTTNRYLTIDPAFESRVDVILSFPELDEPSRAQIWRNFLQKDEAVTALGEEAISILANVPLNGRQIKSAVKTARVLAAGEGVLLNVEHIRIVVRLRNRAARLLGSGYPSQ
ncbi:hypothetical protein G7Z17_g3101 [Cylindrodendrum hubeiense]|uniref:AAA+ ATPase domain-containing protein n=1 Tax=Cylindrodendrum hubeiense TaxID=595255 RepID=A0A9P5HBG7_9HYPO|nr:hypothetical protein G7Z17_g3101 [Cylindrodendrum hubeiense]